MIEVRDEDRLRKVNLDGYILELWATNRLTGGNHGKEILGYRLTAPADKGGDVIFEAEDFGCSPVVAIDSDTAIRELMGFLTLVPGDTDREYFEKYTDRQKRFCEDEAESLKLFGFTDEDDETPLPEIIDAE